MKNIFVLLAFLFLSQVIYGQKILSNVYAATSPGIILHGENNPMKYFQLELIQLAPNKKYKKKTRTTEHLILAKSGSPLLTSGTIHNILTPTSMAMIVKGQKYQMTNTSSQDAWFYVLSYEGRDPSKGSDTAKSFVRLVDDLAFHAHERGGVRSYFDKATSQTKRFEVHATTLKAGLKSHDPHTHKSEEIILMIEGDTEMLIGERHYQAHGGDTYYVESMDLHGIQNKGMGLCSYYAIQWE
ncbi:MAG: cupin domain-containing protein [Saprospiraceae bacterium]|nr:cupin domain-containing protein [Saprospiraceae bacterium]